MTDKQPEALRLAEEGMQIHEYNAPEYKVCAELRRLHKVNAELVEALQDAVGALEYRWETVANRRAPVHENAIQEAYIKSKAALRKAQGDNNEKA